jgi:hypothetical protein
MRTEDAVESMPATKPYVVLIPVFNDWGALWKLLVRLDKVLTEHHLEAQVLLVDDGSTAALEDGFPGSGLAALSGVEVLHLRRNLGHQRALAIGLAYLEDQVSCQAVIVMDGDGEDDPRDVPRLLKKYHEESGQRIIFAERSKRSESMLFIVCYYVYMFLHYLLTSRSVRVGNFSVIPAARLASLVVVSEMWNHYAAAVFKSRQPLAMIPTQRAKRLEGRPQMNFANLVIHGLSAMSVFGDIIGVRLLIATCALMGLAFVGLGCVVLVRLLTELAIAGWATFTVGMLFIILLQGVMFSFVFSFVILANRQGSTFLPLRDYAYFVSKVRRLPVPGVRSEKLVGSERRRSVPLDVACSGFSRVAPPSRALPQALPHSLRAEDAT